MRYQNSVMKQVTAYKINEISENCIYQIFDTFSFGN